MIWQVSYLSPDFLKVKVPQGGQLRGCIGVRNDHHGGCRYGLGFLIECKPKSVSGFYSLHPAL
jgi:hypothetical protein